MSTGLELKRFIKCKINDIKLGDIEIIDEYYSTLDKVIERVKIHNESYLAYPGDLPPDCYHKGLPFYHEYMNDPINYGVLIHMGHTGIIFE